MPVVVIVPVKSFRGGKRRLAGALSDEQRQHLGRRLAAHVAATVAGVGLTPLIVTADPEVAMWATRSAYPSLPDPAMGLDAAAAAGVAWAGGSASPWIVLHGDLPLLTSGDVAALATIVDEGGSALAPSSDGGTSAIASTSTTFDFAFGVASFHRHLARLGSPTIVVRTGLCLDVDSPVDLAAVSRMVSWVAGASR